MEKLQIYCDGACSNNPGPGGWGVVMLFGGQKRELSGFEPDTTNNRMELLSAIQGLRAVKPVSFKLKPGDKAAEYSPVYPKVEVYSDSAYLVNAINCGWVEKWQLNGWRTADKTAVKNKDLWLEIIEFNRLLSPVYIKVKGHSDNEHNNRADELAVLAIRK